MLDLEESVLPRLARLEAMFAQQQQYSQQQYSQQQYAQQQYAQQQYTQQQQYAQQQQYMSASSPWSRTNQPAYCFPPYAQHSEGYIQQSSSYASQHTASDGGLLQQSTPQQDDRPECSNVTPSQPQNAPQCKQILLREATNYLPSSSINTVKLITPEAVLDKYRTLRVESKIGVLAVKLAKEAYFGEDVLVKCTVSGCRSLPALPLFELNELKQFLFNQFPRYWHSPEEFEGLWERVGESVGQCCKGLRKKLAAK